MSDPARSLAGHACGFVVALVFAPVLATVLALVLAFVAGPAAGATASGLPALPPGARVESVVEEGAVGGQRVAVLRIRSDGPPGPIVDALVPGASDRGAGAGAMGAVVEVRSGPWQVVSAREGSGYRTLQWRALPGGGTEALLSLWRGPVGSSPSAFDLDAAVPRGAIVLRRFSATDGGRRNATLVAWTSASVPDAAAQVHARLRAAGLEAGALRGSADAGISRLYRGRGHEVALAVTPHPGRSGLVLHYSEVSP